MWSGVDRGQRQKEAALHDHWHMYRVEELWLTTDEFLTG
jgi:hypothetical protein